MFAQMKLMLLVTAAVSTRAFAASFGDAELVFDWGILEFDWPSEEEKTEAIKNGSYVPDRSLIAGIKIYKNYVFLAIPRWFWTTGIPVTVARVVRVQGQVKLRPYPNWAAQKQGDCRRLQYVQGMEIDPNTGLMYLLDSGIVGNVVEQTNFLPLCPAKIVVYDLNTDTQVDSYELPEKLVSRTRNSLNDIVLDYVDGEVRFVYFTDIGMQLLHIYDLKRRKGHNLDHPSMKPEGNNATVIQINNKDYIFNLSVDGIAISPNFKYLYFCPTGGFNLHQVRTWELRDPHYSKKAEPRLVGRKISQSDGLAHGSKHLFYPALSLNAVYYWNAKKDKADQGVGIGKVKLATQVELVRNDTHMTWPDTFAFDHKGCLWFVTNNFNTFVDQITNRVSIHPINRVWKVYVNEPGYLYGADKRTAKRKL